VRFDSVVFADSAWIAALSCFGRLKADRDAGRKTLVVPLVDCSGAGVISGRGLGSVRGLEELEAAERRAGPTLPLRERMVVVIRRVDPKHVFAPLGLLGAAQAIDYFNALLSALSVDRGRDLLFFEERPECLVPEVVPLRLAIKGVRLPPASELRSPCRYAPFRLRLVTGFGIPPIYGGLRERSRLSRAQRTAFQEAAGWDPQRALGPRLQPVTGEWSERDTTELFEVAAALGQESRLGSMRSFKRGIARHAAGAGSPVPIERCWLSLPNPPGADADPGSDAY
jgi:hypothetical protein